MGKELEAKWVRLPDEIGADDGARWECSNCGRKISTVWYLTPSDPVCSLCGARMTGVVEKVPKKKYRIVPKPIDVVIEAESPEHALMYFGWELEDDVNANYEAIEIQEEE